MLVYFEERITDSGEALHSHGQGEVGGGCDGDLTDGQQEGEHLGVPVIAPNPQQTFIVRSQHIEGGEGLSDKYILHSLIRPPPGERTLLAQQCSNEAHLFLTLVRKIKISTLCISFIRPR